MKALFFATLLACGSLLSSPALAQTDDDLGAADNAPTDAEATETASDADVEANEKGRYEPTRPFDKAERERRPETFGHFGQFGIRAGITFPYKINFRMDDSPPCDDGSVSVTNPEKKVCPTGTPPALDLALSFGVLDALEPFVWVRLGLGQEKTTHTASTLGFGAGVRIYTMSESRFKVFFEPAAAVLTEGASNPQPGRNYQTDILAHLHVGGHFDFMRHVGASISLGPEASFFRAITVGIAGTIAVQARFP